ncbi:DUF86 domain-containing protein [Actinomyces sp.]|uniref:HepT-like ribonuclease domain-containing protein n=1 Tax=Actinomyces sp. TaxID=29317 RepID=UPI0026DCFAE5|nr:HepT-like ribonuclease domain-containing protein [Actinomyces sp.]MDO4899817.1 DUF86 domain-containing protein [Actinomyces sp.]
MSEGESGPAMGKRAAALAIMRDALDLADAVVAKGAEAFFSADDPTQLAAGSYALVILGEAVARMPQEVVDAYPELPWREARGIRNVMAHYQATLDPVTVWETLEHDLDGFRRLVDSYGP